MDYQAFLVRLPGHQRPTRGISRLIRFEDGALSISTLSPSNPVVESHTYSGISDVKCSHTDALELTFKTLDATHSFVCNSRDRFLTTLHNKLDDLSSMGSEFLVKKLSNHHGGYCDVVLKLRNCSILKLTSAHEPLASAKKLNLTDILKIQTAVDAGEQIMLIHMKSRVWQLLLDPADAEQFASTVQQNAKRYLERHIPVENISKEEVVLMKNARTESLRSSTILFEFSVIKNNEAKSDMQRERTIAITEDFMAEVSGSQVVALHSLSDILGLVVSDSNELEVVVEFRDWHPTHYYVSDREAFVGSLADTVQNVAKNSQFSIRLEPSFQYTLPEKPLPLFQNEYEIYLISRFMSIVLNSKEGKEQLQLQEQERGKDGSQGFKDRASSGDDSSSSYPPLCSDESQSQWFPILKEYAVNMLPGDSMCIDGRPMFSIGQILKASLEINPTEGASYAVTCCAVIQRLLGSRAVFESVKTNQDFVVTMNKAIRHPNAVMAYAAACTFCAAVKVRQASDANPSDQTAAGTVVSFLRNTWQAPAEAANKHAVLTADNIQVLVARLQTDALLQQNALQVQGILEILTLALNLPPVSDAEAERQWQLAFEACLMVAADVLAALTRSKSGIMLCSTLQLLQTIYRRCTPGFIEKFQELLLSRAVALLLLKNALFNKLQRARRLATELLHTMAESCPEVQQLLTRVLPKGFFWVLQARALSKQLDTEAKGPSRNISPSGSKETGIPSSSSNSNAAGTQGASGGPGSGGSGAPGLQSSTSGGFSVGAAAAAVALATQGSQGGMGGQAGSGSGTGGLPPRNNTLSQTFASAVALSAAAAVAASSSMGLPGTGAAAAAGAGAGAGGAGSFAPLGSWQDALDLLRLDTVATPVLVWNDAKRHELHKFLNDQVEALDESLGRASKQDVRFNAADVSCTYSPESDGNELCKTIINDIHVEHLLHSEPAEGSGPGAGSVTGGREMLALLYQLQDPAGLFQAVTTSLLVCFTPLYGTCEIPEIEPRLAVDVLTWLFERHGPQIAPLIDSLRVIEMFVAMLREAVDNGHSVFAFKSMLLLQTLLQFGGRPWVNRFVKAAGISVLVPLMVASLAKCCKDPTTFECDAPSLKDGQGGLVETVPVVGSDGEVRMARVPCSRLLKDAALSSTASIARKVSLGDGTMEARVAIRWQDDSVPEKVQLGMALELLECLLGIVELEGSSERFPVSLAWGFLSQPETISCLLQLLLRAKAPVFRRVLDLALTLTRINQKGLSELYKSGVFEMLLWKLLAGDIWEEDRVRIAKFLWRTHLVQDPAALEHAPVKGLVVVDHLPWQDSILRLYVPAGLICKLIQEGPEVFQDYLKQDGLDSAEVIWNAGMKERLVDYLATDLEPFVLSRSADPLTPYVYSTKSPLAYPELAGTIFVAPVYLHNLLDVARMPSHQAFDSSSFHQSILAEYARVLRSAAPGAPSGTTWRHEAPRLALLLKAQAAVMERYPEIPIVPEAESVVIDIATPALRMCIAQREECPALMTDILSHATRILCSIAKTREPASEVSSPAISFALSILSCGTRAKSEATFPETCAGTALEPAVVSSLGILEQAAGTLEGRRVLKDDVRWRKGFWWALCSAAGDAAGAAAGRQGKPSKMVFTALDCLNHFAGDKDLCFRVIKQGLLLPLLLLAVPASPESSRHHMRDSADGAASSEPMELVAAQVLRTLTVTLDQAPEEEGVDMDTGAGGASASGPIGKAAILCPVLPYGLVLELKQGGVGGDTAGAGTWGAEKFVELVSSNDVKLPMAIWNAEVRAEMRKKVTQRLKKCSVSVTQVASSSGAGSDEIEWLAQFKYESLENELVIGGVLVDGYAHGAPDGFELPDGQSFMQALLKFLEERACVLDAVQETPAASLPHATRKDFLTTLKALAVCVRGAVKGGQRGLVARLDYNLLAGIMDAAGRSGVAEAQGHIIDVVQYVSGAPSCREQLLGSPLLPVLAEQLWRQLSKKGPDAGGAARANLAMRILDALLANAVEMAAVIAITNLFSSSGMLLVLLFLLLRLPLPALPDPSSDFSSAAPQPSGTPRVSLSASSSGSRLDEDVQIRAAQILGQVLLAASGTQRRKHPNGASGNGNGSGKVKGAEDSPRSEDGAHPGDSLDVMQLVGLLDEGADLSVAPVTVRHMYLLLPIHILKLLMEDPLEACSCLARETCSPTLVWNDGAAKRTRVKLRAEAAAMVRRWKSQWEDSQDGQVDLLGLPEWNLEIPGERPVFLRYVLEEVQVQSEGQAAGAGQAKEMFADEEKEGYAPEMCLSGWYVDQVLRQPDCDMGGAAGATLMRELRKMLIMAAPTEGKRSADFSAKDRRRLLLCLLLLFRSQHKSLSLGNTTDILLPVLDMVCPPPAGNMTSAGGGMTSAAAEERRELVQVAMLLLDCMVTSSDVADFLCGDELLGLLGEMLILDVPPRWAGKEGTDPRMCALVLLIRLVRASSNAVQACLRKDIVQRLVALFIDVENALSLRILAASALHCMQSDRRHKNKVKALLVEMIPDNFHKHAAWLRGAAKDAGDEHREDPGALQYFLSHRKPCAGWWTTDTPEGTQGSSGDGDEGGPTSVVEASTLFPKAKFDHFSEEVEGCLRFCLAAAAGVAARDARILRKRPSNGMLVEIEVQFKTGPGLPASAVDGAAKAFKARLEAQTASVLSDPLLEPLGAPSTKGIRIQSWGYHR